MVGEDTGVGVLPELPGRRRWLSPGEAGRRRVQLALPHSRQDEHHRVGDARHDRRGAQYLDRLDPACDTAYTRAATANAMLHIPRLPAK